MNKDFFLAVAILAGTIIGAGIFSLPYVFSQLGFVLALIYLIAFVLVYFVIHSMYAELVVKHRGRHEFAYLARQYLPQKVSGLATLAILFELLFVLVVYLTLIPSFLKVGFGLEPWVAVFLLWALGSLFMFMRLPWLEAVETAGIAGIFLIVMLIFFAGGERPFIPAASSKTVTLPLLVLPFGPLLFAFSGRPAISRLVDAFSNSTKKKKLLLKHAIFWGGAVPGLIYLGFVMGVLRLTPNPTPDTLGGLGFLSPIFLAALGLLGFLTIWTSYFVIGINAQEILQEDLRLPKALSAAVAVFVPLALYLVGFDTFFQVVAFTGGTFLALEGIFVVAMHEKAFPESSLRTFALPLYAVFLTALIYEVATFIL